MQQQAVYRRLNSCPCIVCSRCEMRTAATRRRTSLAKLPRLPLGQVASHFCESESLKRPVTAQVKVADRSVVTTSHAETRVVSPAGLQQLIDEAVTAAPSGQCHVY